MEERTKQRWVELCSEAAVSEDLDRFEELLEEITTLLKQEKDHLEERARKFMGVA
ncbi:MAG: hypothetical protein JO356_14705 [Acidobacteria bacterium]|nr:hypothetical protein [Acidobacteriota bacterium]